MKKIILALTLLTILTACAGTSPKVNNELNLVNSEMHSLQLIVDELQNQVGDLSLRNELLKVEIGRSKQLISDLETDIAYINNEILVLRQGGTSPIVTKPATQGSVSTNSTNKKSKVTVIDESNLSKDSLYNYAFEQYRQGNYNESIQKFQEFLRKYPTDDLANNSQYWIGENYYSMKDYNKALDQFELVLKNYPKGSKVPDAMLKIGYCYVNVGQNEKAKNIFQSLVNQYPHSSSSKLANQTLAKLK